MPAFRAIASVMLQVGIAAIPIKMVKGTESPDKALTLHQVHTKDNGEAGRRIYCKTCDATLEQGDISRAASGVIIPEDVLDQFKVESDSILRVDEFVPLATVDLRLYDEPRYIVPDKGGADPLRAFADTMLDRAEAGNPVAAIGKVAEREREKVVAIYAMRVEDKPALVAYTLRWPDEVREATYAAEQTATGKAVTAPLKGMVNELIDAMSADAFNPAAYTDTKGRERDRAILAIVSGSAPVVAKVAATAAPTNDLMAALQASVKAAKATKTSKKTKAA